MTQTATDSTNDRGKTAEKDSTEDESTALGGVEPNKENDDSTDDKTDSVTSALDDAKRKSADSNKPPKTQQKSGKMTSVQKEEAIKKKASSTTKKAESNSTKEKSAETSGAAKDQKNSKATIKETSKKAAASNNSSVKETPQNTTDDKKDSATNASNATKNDKENASRLPKEKQKALKVKNATDSFSDKKSENSKKQSETQKTKALSKEAEQNTTRKRTAIDSSTKSQTVKGNYGGISSETKDSVAASKDRISTTRNNSQARNERRYGTSGTENTLVDKPKADILSESPYSSTNKLRKRKYRETAVTRTQAQEIAERTARAKKPFRKSDTIENDARNADKKANDDTLSEGEDATNSTPELPNVSETPVFQELPPLPLQKPKNSTEINKVLAEKRLTDPLMKRNSLSGEDYFGKDKAEEQETSDTQKTAFEAKKIVAQNATSARSSALERIASQSRRQQFVNRAANDRSSLKDVLASKTDSQQQINGNDPATLMQAQQNATLRKKAVDDLYKNEQEKQKRLLEERALMSQDKATKVSSEPLSKEARQRLSETKSTSKERAAPQTFLNQDDLSDSVLGRKGLTRRNISEKDLLRGNRKNTSFPYGANHYLESRQYHPSQKTQARTGNSDDDEKGGDKQTNEIAKRNEKTPYLFPVNAKIPTHYSNLYQPISLTDQVGKFLPDYDKNSSEKKVNKKNNKGATGESDFSTFKRRASFLKQSTSLEPRKEKIKLSPTPKVQQKTVNTALKQQNITRTKEEDQIQEKPKGNENDTSSSPSLTATKNDLLSITSHREGKVSQQSTASSAWSVAQHRAYARQQVLEELYGPIQKEAPPIKQTSPNSHHAYKKRPYRMYKYASPSGTYKSWKQRSYRPYKYATRKSSWGSRPKARPYRYSQAK